MTEQPDIFKLAKNIAYKINELEKAREELSRLAQNVAKYEGIYRAKLAKTCIQLKNGVKFELDGAVIENPPASTTLTIAHGICAAEKIKAQEAEILWRSQMKIADMLQAELNGLQSINKNLSEV